MLHQALPSGNAVLVLNVFVAYFQYRGPLGVDSLNVALIGGMLCYLVILSIVSIVCVTSQTLLEAIITTKVSVDRTNPSWGGTVSLPNPGNHGCDY